MSDVLGAAAIVGGSALGVTLYVLWRRVRAAFAVIGSAGAGAVIGAGALLVQDSASAADWVVTIAVLGGLTPLHARLLFGSPGAPDG